MPTANSMFKMWRRLSATGKTAWVAGTTVVVCAALFFAPEKITPLSSALFARDPYAKESRVEVGARLDRNVLSKGDQAILEVNIQNNNTDPLTEFHASITAPGFEWDQGNAEKQLSGSVPAGSSMNAAIPLRAMSRSGTYTVSVFYSWTKKSRYSSAVSLGPLKMEGLFSQDHWSRFLGRGNQLIKDLTLPIVLAVLGYYFQLRQSVRDAKRQRIERRDEIRRQSAENAREEQRRDAEKLRNEQRQNEEKTRDERQQVRQNILPLVMSLAERHYMPIVTSARVLIGHYDLTKKQPPGSSLDEVSFDTLFLLKRMDYLRRDKGQIFFQDNAAEALAADAWFVLREKLRSVLGDSEVELALQKMGNDDRFADAKRYQMHIQSPSKKFQKWVASDAKEFERYLELVDVIQAVFRFEANRPFSDHWYGTPKKLLFETETVQKSDFLQNPEFPLTGLSNSSIKKIESLKTQWPHYLATVNSP
jgi:hypothetical protein